MADLWRLGVTVYMVAVLIWMGVMLEDLSSDLESEKVVLSVGFIGILISFIGALVHGRRPPSG